MTVGSVQRVENSPTAAFLLSKTFVAVWSFAFALFFFGFATKWTFDPRTIGSYLPGHFFSAQADAMLHGRLWIEGSNLPLECFTRNGNCYGYFGLSPSLIRIPLVIVLGVQDSEMTALFLAMAAGIALWSALDLCRRLILRDSPTISRTTAGYMVVAAIVLGPGGALVLVSDAYVYQEAILWCVAGTMVAVNLFWRWWTERRTWQFVGATAALVFAAGSRPTAMLIGVVLAVAVLAVCIRERRISRRALLGVLAISVLPLVAVFGSFYAKFDSYSPTGDYGGSSIGFIQNNVKSNGGQAGNSRKFIPTATLTYFRPYSFQTSGQWPYVRYRFGRPFGQTPLERIIYLPPAQKDSINVEPIVSITDVMPIPLVMTVLGAAAIALRRKRRFELFILAALCTPVAIMFTTQTIATRYLGDFFPLMAAGTAFGATLLPRFRRLGWNPRFYITLVVVVLTLVSVPVVMMLASQYNWTYRYGTK